MATQPARTIFNYIDNLTLKLNLPYDKKIAPAYLISLWISHCDDYVDIANEINKFQFSLSDELIYRYYYEKIPKRKRFIRWIKKDVTEATKKEKEAEEKLRETFQLSKKEMLNYKCLLSR